MSRIFLIFATKINKYNMSINCIQLSEKDIKTLKDSATLIKNSVVEKATKLELEHALSELSKDKNIDIDIDNVSISDLATIILKQRNEVKNREKELKQIKKEGFKIHGANVVIGDTYDNSSAPRNDKDIFLFGENLQAYLSLHNDVQTDIEVISPEEGVKLNVSKTAAVVRMKDDNTPNDNARGIVVKKNAQRKEGDFINKNSDDIQDSVFKENEKEAFLNINRPILNKIAEELKARKYEKIHLPDLAMNNAGLPKVLADALNELIEETLGILGTVSESNFGSDLYGITFGDGKVKSSKKNTTKKETSKELLESLAKERPVQLDINKQILQQALLQMTYPDIAIRRARVQFIAKFYKGVLDYLTDVVESTLQEKVENGEELTAHEGEIYRMLQSGKDSERRKATLSYKEWENNQSTSDIIFSKMKEFISNASAYVSMDEENKPGISEEDYDSFKEYLADTGLFLNDEYANHSEKQLKKYIPNLLMFCREVNAEPNLFEALTSAASSIIERSTNIKLTFDKTKTIGSNSKLEDMEEEEFTENRAELYLVKQKLVDPKTTLSARVKRLIGECYKVKSVSVDNTGKKTIEYEYSSLGTRVPLQEGVVYYALMKRYAKMNNEKDFLRITEEIAKESPWFSEIADMIANDKDLRNEFYRNFRKVAQIFSVITPSGRIQLKNAELDATAVIDAATKNYEGCNILTEDSLYDLEGNIHGTNLTKWKTLCNAEKENNKSSQIAKHPIAFVTSILNKDTYNINSNDLLTAYQILLGKKTFTVAITKGRGEYSIEEISISKGTPSTSLDNIIKSMGIDTEDINLSTLLPINDGILSEMVETGTVQGKSLNAEMWDAIWPPLIRQKIHTILQGMQILSKTLTTESNLINDFRGVYVSMGSALLGITDDYTQASFYFDGNQRFSYTNPDKISQFIGIVSKTSTEEEIEEGTRYLENNYIDYTFFKDSPLLNTLKNSKDVRKKLSRIEVLSVETGTGASDIANVDDEAFLEGLICAYFNGQNTLIKGEIQGFGYYRNPLFSDAEALNLFKLPKEIFTNYDDRNKVITKLVTILNTEIDRILDFRGKNADEKVKITNYNDKRGNAGKFCFFPFLETRKEEIIQYIEYLSNDIANYENDRRSYLYTLLDEYLSQFSEDFVNSFTEIQKLSLYKRINGINKFNEKVEGNQKALTSSLSSEENLFNEENTDSDIVEEGVKNNEFEGTPKEKEAAIAMVNLWLTEFYFNDYYTQAELIMLLGGDLAYYKDIRDFIKRNKQSYASGERVWALEDDSTPWKEMAIYLKDKEIVSNTFQSIQQLLNRSNMSNMEKDLVAGYLRPYTDINSTDGQGLRSLSSLKKIFKAMGGTWTDGLEEAFEKIKMGRTDFNCWMTLINAIKPFMFTSEKKVLYSKEKESQQRVEKVIVQHKNSEYLISALFSTLNTALNESPELRALQTFMDLHDIDVIQFDSCVKVGGFNSLDLNFAYKVFDKKYPEKTFSEWYKENLNLLTTGKITQEDFNRELKSFSFTLQNESIVTSEVKNIYYKYASAIEESKEQILSELKALQEKYPHSALLALEVQMAEIGEVDAVHELPMEDFMLAQPNTDHLTDAEALIGSQLRNIIMADLPDGFTMPITIGGVTFEIDKKTAIALYDSLFVDTILDNFNKLDNQFDSPESVQTMLMSAMEGNPKYDGDIKNAFELNESKTGFVMPMNSPITNNKAQDLLLSRFKNNIQRLKTDGGNAVLVSNFSLSDNLHVQYKYETDSDGNKVAVAVDYIPCYLPAMWKDVYEDYVEESEDGTYWTINFDLIKENNAEELFNIIGYRIPTEDKYSIMPIKIVGFLPVQAGASMMLPNDIITMSGTDFDIDKLFIMRKSFRKEIAPRDLGINFKEWLVQKDIQISTVDMNLWNKIAKVKQNDEVITIKPLNKGFTPQELRELVDTYPIFADFMNDTYPLYEFPKYVIPKLSIKEDVDILELTKLENVKSFEERRHIRNNMLIDMCWNILTSPEGSRQMMTPATYINVKLSSNREIIMNDPQLLKVFYTEYFQKSKYSNVYEALTNFAEIYGHGFSNTLEGNVDAMQHFIDTVKTPDNPLDISFYVQSHRNLMDGNGLIGGLAVNSSRHYKFQLCTTDEGTSKITIKDNNRFNIDIPGFGSHTVFQIDPRISPITKRPVGRDASQLQAASPDNGKDPRLGNMGISMKTLAQTNAMNSVGIPIETIGFLNRIGDMLSVGRTYMSEHKDFKKSFDLQNFVLDIGELSNIVTKHRLYKAFGGEDSSFESLDNNEMALLAGFTLWWNNILDIAKDLRKASVYVRADSPNGALPTNTTEVIQHLLKIRDLQRAAQEETFTLDGLDTVIDLDLDFKDVQSIDDFRTKIMSSNIPRLQAWYSCGIKSATSLVDAYLPEVSISTLEALEYLQYLTRYDLSKVKNTSVLKTFLNELTTFMLSNKTLFSDKGINEEGDILETRNYYIHDFPIKFKAFLDERNEDGSYKYADIKNLTIIKMMTNNSGKGIKFKNVGGKISIDSRQYLMEGLDAMLRDGRKEVMDFAVDLFMYSYFDNGLNFGHSNFGIFFSVGFTRSMNGFVQALQNGNEDIKNEVFNFKKMIHQFLLNHPNYIPYIQSSYSNQMSFSNTEGKTTVTIPINADSKVIDTILEYESNKKLISSPRKFVRISRKLKNSKGEDYYETKVYMYVTHDSSKYIYQEIDYNKGTSSDRIPFYDSSKNANEIEWSKLQPRGKVISLSKKSMSKAEVESNSIEKTIDTEELGEFKDKEVDVVKVIDGDDKIIHTPEDPDVPNFTPKKSDVLNNETIEQFADLAQSSQEKDHKWFDYGVQVFGQEDMWTSTSTDNLSDFTPKENKDEICGEISSIKFKE